MQTILGSGGSIGVFLAKELTNYTEKIRLVSRNPKKINENDFLVPADLTIREHVYNAIRGSKICYLTIGLEYKTQVWQDEWPPLMKNVIDACIEYQTKLVFFTNVYSCGGDNVNHITEESPFSPTSRKGEVRAGVEKQILTAIEKRGLQAIIARAPDFFGPVKKEQSVLMNVVYDNFVRNRKAQFLFSVDTLHSYGYTPDLAKGTAILGNTPDSYNQIWNLPVDPELLTGKQWIKLFADAMDKRNKYRVMPAWMVKFAGLFIPVLAEVYEMRYQFDRDYFFDSSKFMKRFDFTPTSNAEAVRLTVELLR